MSVAAITWALALPLEPRTKIVLIALADSANAATWVCWPKFRTVAKQSSQSRKTVQRRMKVLEELGVIKRTERYRADGSRSSDEILLCLDLKPTDIVAQVEFEADDEPDSGHSNDAPHGLSDQGGGSTGPVVRTTQSRGPGHCSPGKEPPFEPELSPKSPSSTGAHDARAPVTGRDSSPDLAGLDEFKRVYDHPTTKPGRVEQLWAAMSSDQRKQALAGAHGVAAQRRAGKLKTQLDAARFLADPKLWAEFAGSGGLQAATVRIHEGSEAYAAHLIAYQLRGYREIPTFMVRLDPITHRSVITVKSEFPPLGRGMPAFSEKTWLFFPRDDQRWQAWNARLREEFGDGIRFPRPRWDGDKRANVDGNWFPQEWPPSKGRAAAMAAGTTDPPMKGEASDDGTAGDKHDGT